MRERYELTCGGRLGPGPDDCKEASILNRIIRWTSNGIEYEADPRQGEKLLHELSLDSKTNGCVTPGVKVTAQQAEGDSPLNERDFTRYRAHAARANYLAADRPDLLFACKEICRFMSAPTELAQQGLKRMARYLRSRPRLVWRYDYQTASGLEVYTDTDWAGCVRTRKSTSGGCLLLGNHVLKTWSATQASLALSSGEAEFYGVVKGAGIGIGQAALFNDVGLKLPLRVWTDSTAAIGICGRQGLGKLRHIACQTLWVQQRVRRGDFELRKVAGEVNPADLFTKHLESQAKLDSLLKIFGCEFRGGRPVAAPELRREAAADVCHLQSASIGVTQRDLSTKLPHQFSLDVLDAHFPKAAVVPAPLGEPDVEEEWDGRDPAFTTRARALGEKLLSEPMTTYDTTIALVRCEEAQFPSGGVLPAAYDECNCHSNDDTTIALIRCEEAQFPSGGVLPAACEECNCQSNDDAHVTTSTHVARAHTTEHLARSYAAELTDDVDDIHGASSPYATRSLPTLFELSVQTAPDIAAIDRVHYGTRYEDRSSLPVPSIGAGGSFNTTPDAQHEDRSSPRVSSIGAGGSANTYSLPLVPGLPYCATPDGVGGEWPSRGCCDSCPKESTVSNDAREIHFRSDLSLSPTVDPSSVVPPRVAAEAGFTERRSVCSYAPSDSASVFHELVLPEGECLCMRECRHDSLYVRRSVWFSKDFVRSFLSDRKAPERDRRKTELAPHIDNSKCSLI